MSQIEYRRRNAVEYGRQITIMFRLTCTNGLKSVHAWLSNELRVYEPYSHEAKYERISISISGRHHWLTFPPKRIIFVLSLALDLLYCIVCRSDLDELFSADWISIFCHSASRQTPLVYYCRFKTGTKNTHSIYEHRESAIVCLVCGWAEIVAKSKFVSSRETTTRQAWE